VNYIEVHDNLDSFEKYLIKKYKPLLNIEHNPDKSMELKRARGKCVAYARSK